MTTTNPTDHSRPSTAPLLAIDATYVDATTGALYVHEDLRQVRAPWEAEDHLAPFTASEAFGDVESWAKYVARFANDPPPLITWNTSGLHAVLDYGSASAPGRRHVVAKHPFERSPEWKAWSALASGRAVPQREAIEFLEDHAPDIVEPSPSDLMALLRSLRGTVTKAASTTLNEDGSTHVSFEGSTGARAQNGTADLPSQFTIGIPVLKGHLDHDGKAVLYSLAVRLRASVDDQARLALRFSIPLAERALEDVFADRVAAARELLGDGFDVLRAAG